MWDSHENECRGQECGIILPMVIDLEDRSACGVG
jgi:hypothetical protein